MTTSAYYPVARAVLTVVFDGFGEAAKDSQQFVIPVVPKAVTVHRNSYRLADSWEVEIDAGDLPVDPQQVRSGAIEIFLFQMPGNGDDQRIHSRQFATTDDPSNTGDRGAIAGLRKELGIDKANRFTLDNPPMVSGLFDDQSMDMSEDGKWVRISGQDYTAFLAGKQWPPTSRHTVRPIPVGKRLDDTLKAILREADPDRRLELVPEYVKTMPIVGKGEVSAVKRGIPVDESTTYWDVMYKLATRYGLILFVRGNDVVLTAPRTFDGATALPKRLAWGHNLVSLNMTRHLGKEKVPRIVAFGFDWRNRKQIVAEFPDTGLGRRSAKLLDGKVKKLTKSTEKIKALGASGAKSRDNAPLKLDDEFEVIVDYEVGDPVVLRQMAETIYHLRGHSERKMVAVTRDLKDMEESSLMDLSTGDAVEVEWGDFNRELLSNPDVTEDAKYQHLIARDFGSDVARAIAQNYTRLLAQKRPMRVREVTYEYSVENGIRIEMELVDYVVVDRDQGGTSRKSPSDKRLDKVRRADGRRVGNPQLDKGGR